MGFSCQVGKHVTYLVLLSVLKQYFICRPLIVGKFCEGGDSQLSELVWYSWLGGVIIGTMIGANMVLEEHCRAGPRNVVISGR